MKNEHEVPIFDLVTCLSQAVDLVSPAVADHHKRVAYIVYNLGVELGYSEEDQKQLMIAGALHDIGGLSCQDRLDALRFEDEKPQEHAEMGYLLLRTFPRFAEIADMVRFHHLPWNDGEGSIFRGEPVPTGSHLLHLADRIAVLIDPGRAVLSQVDEIRDRIAEQSGKMFVPPMVEAFQSLADKEYFWFDAVSDRVLEDVSLRVNWESLQLEEEEFFNISNLFARIIDYRSRYTASHSYGVGACAKTLGKLFGFSEGDCRLLQISGYLHDLGKLAVPTEILEKPGRYTRDDVDRVRIHAYYTHHILQPLKMMDVIRNWGASHHEHLDGSGYPFHLKGNKLSPGARMVAVADVYTALSENRPYRAGVTLADVLQILQNEVDISHLDGEIVSMLKKHVDEIEEARTLACSSALVEYKRFIDQSGSLLNYTTTT